MYLIALENNPSGVYSVPDEDNDKIIPIFECESDAERYISFLEEDPISPDLQVIEIDGDVMVAACVSSGQRYSIITEDDFIVPPDCYDSLSKDPLEELPEHG
jgi:hypothetical protein